MDNWVFDLQLFAEEGGIGGGGDTAPASPQESSASSDVSSVVSSMAMGQGASQEMATKEGGVGLVRDPVTGRTRVDGLSDPTFTPSQTQATTSEGVPLGRTDGGNTQQDTSRVSLDGVQGAPSLYTEEELISAIARGEVEPLRIPPQYREKVDQAYREIQQKQQVEQARQQAQIAQERAQQERIAKAGAMIGQAAKEATLQMMGVTEAQLQPSSDPYADDTQRQQLLQQFNQLYQQNVAKMQAKFFQEEVGRQEQVKEDAYSRNEISAFTLSESRTEPKYQEILKVMDTLYQKLPYNQAVVVQQVSERLNKGGLLRGDLDVLRGYYDMAKREVYAQMAGVSDVPRPATRLAPPNVEGAGNGKGYTKETFQWENLRNMSNRQRSDVVRSFIMASMNG